jgi:hypothetical protein
VTDDQQPDQPPKPEQGETCAHRGCDKPLKGRTAVSAKDGKRYCKRHGEQLPSYLRSGATGAKGGAKSSRSRRSSGSRGSQE